MAITNVLEYLWLILSAISLALSIRHFWDVSADLNYLDALGRNGIKRSIARAGVQQEAFKIAVQVAMLVGAVIMIFLYRQVADGPLNIMRLVRQVVLITVTVLLMTQTIMDRKMRKKIQNAPGERSTDSKERFNDPDPTCAE